MNISEKLKGMEQRVAISSILAGTTEWIVRYIGLYLGSENAHLFGYLGTGLILYGIYHLLMLKMKFKESV